MRAALQIFWFCFHKIKVYWKQKRKFYRTCVRNPSFWWLQIGHNLEKRQWHHNLLTWRDHQFFQRCLVSIVSFSYWSKFYVNIMTASKVMIIFVYKGLTKIPVIGKTLVWVLTNIWKVEQITDTKFGTNVSNKSLLNAAKCISCSFYRFWLIHGKAAGRVRVNCS